MPELPEVETVVRDLRPHLLGRRIRAIRTSRKPLRRPWRDDWRQLLAGCSIQKVFRRGKWIVLALDREMHLVIHLGMTGQLMVMPANVPTAPHTHVIVDLNKRQEQLRFRDVRRFGSISLFRNRSELQGFFDQACLGPEPFDLDPSHWKERLAMTRRCLKAVLLDQRVVAGVGNIYADESLFEARLNPAQAGCETSHRQAERLRRAVQVVLCRAIDRHGSSIRDYVGGSGRKGEYQNEFRVYDRTGEPCPRCRTAIDRIRLAGRSTHFCPKCQV